MDLADLYSPGGLLADENNDGWSDAVRARVVLRRGASPEEQLAAVNIAARLGFEVMSLTLPIASVNDESEPWPAQVHPIVVGADRATGVERSSRWAGGPGRKLTDEVPTRQTLTFYQ